MKNRLVSLKQIADKLKQNPVMQDLGWEFVVSRAAEVMAIIGTPAMYINKTEEIAINDFRGLLPHDLMVINGISRYDNTGKNAQARLVPMRSNEDIYGEAYAGLKGINNEDNGWTYTASNSALFTNFETGVVIISYKTLATDEECYPLIPGNPELLRAVESYIRYKWYDILNDMDQMSAQKLNKVETEYAWHVGQAQSSMKMPTLDEMETLTNSITQILPSRKQHAQRFQFLGTQEFLKIQV